MSKEFRAARAANTSLKLSDARFLQLTAQVRQVYERIDGALAQALRLNADMIETAQEIGLEPEVGQKLFVDLTECVGTMMQSREKMVAAHTRSTGIRMRTSQAARADGCWPGGITNEPVVTHLRTVA
ncbi:MAG: hypothetical protein LKF30_01470 [Sphingobium sp.]|jgi:uncharacterized protein YdcH (DUF465 family)|nr:hypothetical protein [Sphingobium sp.]MCI1271245.1 hypothetical protein [Sphingobium sp.]MCI1756063.1 hypothetical protein [Sphingobium sp.]MCI2052638.1 hypothetical protein [Sphingobium sp.]